MTQRVPAVKRIVPVFLAAALGLLGLVGCARKEPHVLLIYTWTAYLPDDVVQEFFRRTGIKVRTTTYASNEELHDKLASGKAAYDLVVPSDYMVKTLASERLILPLVRARLSHWENLDPKLLDKKFDPGNRYSVPYFWGTTGIGYNRAAVAEPVTSWAAMFDAGHAGRILMLDDMRECFAAALRTLGRSPNETDPEMIRQAADLLKRQRDLVKLYDSVDFHNILAAGDVDFAQGYNGQLAEAVADEPDRLAYVVPKEGGTFWMDNLCIPAQARHPGNAYAFINFIMEPEINAQLVNGVNYASPNLPARQFIDPEILHNDIIYPPEDVLARCDLMEDIGGAADLMTKYWAEIRADADAAP